MTAYREEQKECVITRQGQANIYKQGNGFKYAIIGYALIKDSNKWLWERSMTSVGDVTAEDLIGKKSTLLLVSIIHVLRLKKLLRMMTNLILTGCVI